MRKKSGVDLRNCAGQDLRLRVPESGVPHMSFSEIDMVIVWPQQSCLLQDFINSNDPLDCPLDTRRRYLVRTVHPPTK